jgi:uncharacterized OB-fold protein
VTDQHQEVPVLVPSLFALDGPHGPHLRGSRCIECGEISFPIRPVCPKCHTEDPEEIALSREGTLYSYTLCFTAPQGWQAPYFQAFVQLREGIRVFTLISDDVEPKLEALRVGMPMELVVEPAHKVDGGGGPVTYKFRPRVQVKRNA